VSTSRIDMFGCPVDVVRLSEAVERVEDYIASGGLHQGVGVNLDQFLKMHEDPEFKKMIIEADLITADGHPIVWTSWLWGTPLPERVPGIDLFEALLPVSARKGYKVFLLGAKEESMQAAAEAYLQRYPGLQIAGRRNGYFTEADEPEIVEQINACGADLLFIAITSPKKEAFVERNRDQLGVKFVLGVGGAFDIAAGLTSRAPIWMRRAGVEWVWRLSQEPRRMWPRVRDNFGFVRVIARETVRRRVLRRA
jgi:N-acetylglucosaminyldiphosphoundecaprenol N-acetyl-beta-D-mannosaminyltransferase